MKHAVPAETAFCALRAVSDRGEGAFDRVRSSDALPVLGREVVEGQQLFSVTEQAFCGFGIFRLECFDEQIEAVDVLRGKPLPVPPKIP